MNIQKLQKAAKTAKLLEQDAQKISNSFKNNLETPISKTSLEPITRLRKDTKELKKVKSTNPDIQFIKDKLKDIIRGV
jgi:hypothetical protein